MNEEIPTRLPGRRRLWMVLAAIAVLLAALIVPPMVSVNRYKRQIAQLISTSLGRPVRLAGVKLRLLPWPGFVLSNLVVEEDPAYGYEPVLHAATVTVWFRLLALWRGRLEISRISVDEASLNVVHAGDGRWNLDPLFRTAAAQAGASAGEKRRRAVPLPYLEATDSRIDFKEGVEKLPFSIVNADLSFWQEAPGDWHLRLRGQPARTDVSLYQEDTGVVRLEASLHSAPALREMPLHVDLDWREAQLGQLSRLLIGSDPGWRGNLTAELHLDGTADTAHGTARLQATGVHRAEFAPAEPLDFDANCGFVYHYSRRALDDLACNSPLGDGRVRLAGDLPGGGQSPHFTVALERIPVDAGLDFLRTIRSGIDPSLSAAGTVSAKMTYTGGAGETAPAGAHAATTTGRTETARTATAATGRRRSGKTRPPALPLAGSFTIDGFELTGDGLSRPMQAARFVLEPEELPGSRSLALTAPVAIRVGAPVPLTFTPSLTLHGYQLSIRGQVSLARARELAHVAGIPDVTALDALNGEPVTVALDAEGSWLPTQPPEQETPLAVEPASGALPDPDAPLPGTDRLSGTLTLHEANWTASYLARRVHIPQATLHLAAGGARWDPVDFSYGPVKGTASLTLPTDCPPQANQQPCPAQFQVQFGNVNAAVLQSAILGAREPGSLFSALIARLHLSSAPAWPEMDGMVQAESLALGPVTLAAPTAALRILPDGAKIESLDARLLGGQVHLSGAFTKPSTDEGAPAYTVEAKFDQLSPAALGKLLGMNWSGGPLNAEGKIQLSGLTARDLAASATGTLHFDWRNGSMAALSTRRAVFTPARDSAQPKPAPVPPALAHFTSFSGEAKIADGAMTLVHGQVTARARRRAVEAELILGNPPRLTFGAPRDAQAAKRADSRPLQ